MQPAVDARVPAPPRARPSRAPGVEAGELATRRRGAARARWCRRAGAAGTSVVSVGDASFSAASSARPASSRRGAREHGHAVAALEQVRATRRRAPSSSRARERVDAGVEPRVEAGSRRGGPRGAARTRSRSRRSPRRRRRSSRSRTRGAPGAAAAPERSSADDRVLERRRAEASAAIASTSRALLAHAELDRLAVVLGPDQREQRQPKGSGLGSRNGFDAIAHPTTLRSHVARTAAEPRLGACTRTARSRTARRLHARPPRERPAHPLVAHGRQLRRVPRAPPRARARRCSTSAAGRARSRSTSPGGCGPARSSASTPRAEVVDRANGLAASEGVANVEFRVGDAYALDFDDDTFDVVHAHQVLQHLARPGRRAARVPSRAEARRARRGSRRRLRRRHLEPRIGRARRAGSSSTTTCTTGTAASPRRSPSQAAGRARRGSTTSRRAARTWVFSSDARTRVVGRRHGPSAPPSRSSPRTRSSRVTRATTSSQRIAAAWREWAADDDGWFLMPHGEIIARA